MFALPIFLAVIVTIPIADTLECHSLFYYNDRAYKDTIQCEKFCVKEFAPVMGERRGCAKTGQCSKQGCLETPLFINCCCNTNLCNNDTLVPPWDPEPDAAAPIFLFSLGAVAVMIAMLI